METANTALPFVGFAIVIGIGLVLAGLFGLPAFLEGLNFSLLTKTRGVQPDPVLRSVAGVLVIVIIILTCVFWWMVKLITDDYPKRLAAAKASALPSAAEEQTTEQDVFDCALQHFKNQGFTEKLTFDSVEGGELVLLSKFEQDSHQIWRAEGVFLNEDAESTRFSAAVIYGDGAWVEGSAKKIRRKGLRREVHIETVLNSSELREVSDTNDYLLSIGLASNTEDEDSDRNWRLSFARAHNIGLAALKLGWKSEDRIWPQALGYSKTLATNDAEERQQRPVILIGVIANRQVSVPDVTFAAMQIIPINLIDLNSYSASITSPGEPRRVARGSQYLDESDMNPRFGPTDARTLPAVRESAFVPADCDAEDRLE